MTAERVIKRWDEHPAVVRLCDWGNGICGEPAEKALTCGGFDSPWLCTCQEHVGLLESYLRPADLLEVIAIP